MSKDPSARGEWTKLAALSRLEVLRASVHTTAYSFIDFNPYAEPTLARVLRTLST